MSGGIDLGSQFNFTSALPLDARDIVANLTARDAIASGIRYIGLKTFCLADKKTYQLQAGITNADWVDISSSYYLSTANALTALSGGGQTGATLASANINRFTTVAAVGDSAILPAAKAGLEIMIINDGANDMNIFPASTESIDALSANAAYSLSVDNKNVTFVCPVDGIWRSKAGGGGTGKPDLFGSTASPRIIGATGILSSNADMSTKSMDQIIFVQTSGSEIIVTANPRIQAGTVVGQRMRIFGTSSANYIVLQDGNGLSLAGGDSWYSFLGNMIELVWDGANWFETYRRG